MREEVDSFCRRCRSPLSSVCLEKGGAVDRREGDTERCEERCVSISIGRQADEERVTNTEKSQFVK